MLKASISLHLDDATTYATAYLDERPVATVRRRRMYGGADRKTWTVYDLNGAELFQTNLGSVTIRSRLASILTAREVAALDIQPNQRVRYVGTALPERTGAEGVVTYVGQTKAFVRFDGSEGGTACDPLNLIVLDPREGAVEVARAALKTAENAMHHARRIDAEDVKEREDAYSAAIVDLERALGARNALKVCDKTHDAVVSVSALALFEAGKVDQAWALAQLDSGLSPEATKGAWIVWAHRALRVRKEA